MSVEDPDWSNISYLATWVLSPLALLFYPLQLYTMLEQRRSLGVSFTAYVWSIVINCIFIVFAVLCVYWQTVIFTIMSVLLDMCVILLKVRIERMHSLTKQTLLEYIASDLELADQCEWTYIPEHHHIVIKPRPGYPLYEDLGNNYCYISYIKRKDGSFRCEYVEHMCDHLSQAPSDPMRDLPSSVSEIRDRMPPIMRGHCLFHMQTKEKHERKNDDDDDDIKHKDDITFTPPSTTHSEAQQEQQESNKRTPVVIPPEPPKPAKPAKPAKPIHHQPKPNNDNHRKRSTINSPSSSSTVVTDDLETITF